MMTKKPVLHRFRRRIVEVGLVGMSHLPIFCIDFYLLLRYNTLIEALCS